MIERTIEADGHEFGLFWGGLDNLIFRRIVWAGSDARRVALRVVLFSGAAFLPLCVLCAIEGTLWWPSRTIPLFGDTNLLIRSLLCVPLMLIAELAADRGTTRVARYLRHSGLLRAAAAQSYESLVARVVKLGDSILPELALIAIALLMIGVEVDVAGGASSWRRTDSGAAETGLTLAGQWHRVVGLSIYRFLLLRWMWRYAIWCWFLWRVARLPLGLTATHPDQAAGLQFVATGQSNFGLLIVALSAQVSSMIAQGMLAEQTPLAAYYPNIAAHVVAAAILFLGPLCVFSAKLFACKRRGTFEYGTLGETYTNLFERKWIDPPRTRGDTLLGSPDIQSLADLANSYDVVRGMRLFPFDKYDVLALVSPAIIPFLPLLLIEYPVDELARGVMNLVL